MSPALALVGVALLSALARCSDASVYDMVGGRRYCARPAGRAQDTAFVGNHLPWNNNAECKRLPKCRQMPPAAGGGTFTGGALIRNRVPLYHVWCEYRASTVLRVKRSRDFVDHYQVLGVTAGAEPSEIKRVFRELSRKYHPDVNRALVEEDVYLRITAAYNILSHPERRAAYDTKHLFQTRPGSSLKKLATTFENELEKQWTTPVNGHVCSVFCTCDPGPVAPHLKRGKMKAKTRTVGRAGDAQAPQDTEEMGDSFGDVGRVLTPPSTFAELNSFLSQAKRAPYSRPSIYTCTACGGASANRDQCDLCGAMQSGPTKTTRKHDRVTPVYSMHNFGSHLDEERRHELVHKNHISRSSPAHTRRTMPNDMSMPNAADIDTGVQRIWGQVSPTTDMPESPFGSGRFEAGLDFFGVTQEAPADARQALAEGLFLEGGVESSDVNSAISGGCWLLGDMESDLTESEQRKRFAVQKSVLQKETQVAVWEAKVEQCKQELADLERNLAQARGELLEAKARQGWSGAGAVGMGGAGAVFSSAAAAASATWTAPASQLSNVFSTLSPMPHVTQKQQRDWSTTSVSVDIAKGWSGPGGVGMGGAGAVMNGGADVPYVAPGQSRILSTELPEQLFSGEFSRKRGDVGEDIRVGAIPADKRSHDACSHDACVAMSARRSELVDVSAGSAGGMNPFSPPMMCGTCGCHTSAGVIRCDCCGSPVSVQKTPEGTGLTKVFTMHKEGRTQLSEQVMHTLVHPRHHSEHHAESLSEAALQGRFEVDYDYFGIATTNSPPVSYHEQQLQQDVSARKARALEAGALQAAAAAATAQEEETARVTTARFCTLDELNTYFSSQPGTGASYSVSATPDADMASVLREMPDVPWQVGGGLEQVDILQKSARRCAAAARRIAPKLLRVRGVQSCAGKDWAQYG